MLTSNDLHPQQKDAVRFILKNRIGCIAFDCGVGKTIIGLTLLRVIQQNYPTAKMLVVSTAKGVKTTWASEHKQWLHTKDLKVSVLTGSPSLRVNRLRANADVYVISYNSLSWLLEQPNLPMFDIVYADEGSCLKGASSSWRDALIKLSTSSQYRVIASATPAPHDEMDYWGLCKFLDDGECLGAKNVSTFRAIYCQQVPIPGRVVFKLRKGMGKVIVDKVSHLFFTGAVPEEANIPVEYKIVKTELSPESKKIYDTVEKDQCLNSLSFTELGQLRTQDSLDAMALSNKLSQLSNGFIYADKDMRLSEDVLSSITDVRALIRNERTAIEIFDDRIVKFKKMINIIHNKHGWDKNIVITYLFKHDLEQLKKAFPEGVSDTEDNIVDRWNKGQIKYLFLQYSRSAMSLNLQKGGNIMAVYSRTFNFQDWYQIVRRIARQGQKEPKVYVYILHLSGTIDDVKQMRANERGVKHRNFQKKIIEERR